MYQHYRNDNKNGLWYYKQHVGIFPHDEAKQTQIKRLERDLYKTYVKRDVVER